ncbi:uncharacterized protein EV420DRAFT_1017717 [Desarmillaria tabescens]|uniref:Uncharacterized protein n=1 Tax=Armillaria tabescens TaxID=1929756 RepID=A0AA39MS29_ARMTA|nr:uncharacterized protein EV420DRAFT_1017717 [Desarmillaria tabescens]KAK0443959.1 hypothetical protein EV420DRAFT_1017717 [Desarmillaria tabescens]
MYTNPLHPSIPNTYQSGFSALGPAVIGTSDASLHPSWKRVPQIPLSCQSSRTPHSQSPIIFEMRGVKYKGISVRDLMSRGPAEIPQMLVGGNDVYLQGGQDRIYLRVPWPGYEHLNYFYEIKFNPRTGITLAILAEEIGSRINQFYSAAQYAASSKQGWRVGPRNIRLEHMILLSLWNTHENCWQAEIAIHS